MKAYSQDLRERVLRAIDQGKSRKEIIELLGVSLATIKRYLKQRREQGHVRPKVIPGRAPLKNIHRPSPIFSHGMNRKNAPPFS